MRYKILTLLALIASNSWGQQDKPLDMKMDFEEYDPKSTLVVPTHIVTRAKFPFIDIHNHQRDTSEKHLAELIADMDALNMRILIDSPVDGGCCDWLRKAVANTKQFREALKGADPKKGVIINFTSKGTSRFAILKDSGD